MEALLWVIVVASIWCMWFQVLYHRDLHRYSDFDVGDFELLAIGASIWICVTSYSSPCHHCALVIIFTKILSRNSNLNLDQFWMKVLLSQSMNLLVYFKTWLLKCYQVISNLCTYFESPQRHSYPPSPTLFLAMYLNPTTLVGKETFIMPLNCNLLHLKYLLEIQMPFLQLLS